MMKSRILASVAAVALMTGAAQAADLPSFEAPAIATAAPLAYDWTGFYVGANVGGAFGDFDVFVPAGPASADVDGDGILGGLQAGYNQQFGMFVAGIEADIQYSNIDGSAAAFGANVAGELEYFGTLRARGGVAFDRLLVYATGGLAYGSAEATLSGGGVSQTRSEDHFGYTVGGGAEYALTENLTVKGEYLYLDLEKKRYDFPAFGVSSRVDYDGHIVRAGVNYKF